MGVRNKFLLNEAIVFGLKYFDPDDIKQSNGSYLDSFIRKKRKLKARKLKDILNRYRIDSYQDLLVLEKKFPIGSLFAPCSCGIWNSRLASVEFTRVGGFLSPDEFVGTDGRMHGFGGCGSCDPFTRSEVEKHRDSQIAHFRDGKPDGWESWKPEDDEYRAKMVEYYSNIEIHDDGTVTEHLPRPR